jgi:hypothetical protein
MDTNNTAQGISVLSRLSSLLEYVEHTARLTEKTIFSIREHKNLAISSFRTLLLCQIICIVHELNPQGLDGLANTRIC